MYRIGIGSDIHRLAEGKRLIIGGVAIDSDLGADSHSDGDVLLHALTDAIFGALAEGDIGTHFPNSEERWRNAESSVFLRFAVGLMNGRGYRVKNVDAVVELERPKLRGYIEAMRENIAAALEIDAGSVSVKAKTGEGVDAVGEGRAVRAQAAVILVRA